MHLALGTKFVVNKKIRGEIFSQSTNNLIWNIVLWSFSSKEQNYLCNCLDIDGYQAALFLQVFTLSKNIFSLTFTELWLCSSLVQLILRTFPWVTFHFCTPISQAKILRVKKIAYSHTIRKIQTEGSKIRLLGLGPVLC